MAHKRQHAKGGIIAVGPTDFLVLTTLPSDLYVSERDKTGCLDSSPLQVDLRVPHGFGDFLVKTGSELADHVFVELLYSDLTLPMVYSAASEKMETLQALHCRHMTLNLASSQLTCHVERQGFPLSSVHALRPFVLVFSLSFAKMSTITHAVKTTAFFVHSRMRATGRTLRARKSSVPVRAVSSERRRCLEAALHLLAPVSCEPAVSVTGDKKRRNTPTEPIIPPIQACICACDGCVSPPLTFGWEDFKDEEVHEETLVLGGKTGEQSPLRCFWSLHNFD